MRSGCSSALASGMRVTRSTFRPGYLELSSGRWQEVRGTDSACAAFARSPSSMAPAVVRSLRPARGTPPSHLGAARRRRVQQCHLSGRAGRQRDHVGPATIGAKSTLAIGTSPKIPADVHATVRSHVGVGRTIRRCGAALRERAPSARRIGDRCATPAFRDRPGRCYADHTFRHAINPKGLAGRDDPSA